MSQEQTHVRDLALPGVKVWDIKKTPDERGYFAELIRKDWAELLGQGWISQANLMYSYPGIIKAWHRHTRGQVDYFVVLKGAMRIVAYDGDVNSKTYSNLVEVVSSEHHLQVVSIPGYYWHGMKTLGIEPSLTVYFTSNMYDYSAPDEERKPWNDISIRDPKTGQPYDWNYPPHK